MIDARLLHLPQNPGKSPCIACALSSFPAVFRYSRRFTAPSSKNVTRYSLLKRKMLLHNRGKRGRHRDAAFEEVRHRLTLGYRAARVEEKAARKGTEKSAVPVCPHGQLAAGRFHDPYAAPAARIYRLRFKKPPDERVRLDKRGKIEDREPPGLSFSDGAISATV